MKAQMEFLDSQIKDNILPYDVSYYGDWCAVSNGMGCSHKSSLINTFMYIEQCDLFAQFAKILNNTKDATTYLTNANNSRNAVYENFYAKYGKGYFMDPEVLYYAFLFFFWNV